MEIKDYDIDSQEYNGHLDYIKMHLQEKIYNELGKLDKEEGEIELTS